MKTKALSETIIKKPELNSKKRLTPLCWERLTIFGLFEKRTQLKIITF